MPVKNDVVTQLEQQLSTLKVSLQFLDTSLVDPAYSEVDYKIQQLLPSIEEFYAEALLKPGFHLDKLQLKKLEDVLLSLEQDLTEVLDALGPSSLTDKAQWILERFLFENKPRDRTQQLVSLSLDIHRFLNTAFFNQIEKNPFLALIVDVVGWSEHLASQGNNDPSSVVLFGAKLAKDQATIQSRIKLAKEICLQLWGLSTEEIGRSFFKEQLHFYKLLLEDLEIILVSSEDPELFKTYCEENTIEIYQEYQEITRKNLEDYARDFPFNLHEIIEKLSTAIIISSAELLIRQYEQVHEMEDIRGLDLKVDQYILEGIMRTLGKAYPTILLRCRTTLERIKQLRLKL